MKKKTKRTFNFRSGLEVKVAEQLDSLGVDWDYEPFSIKFERPAQTSRYTPDFLIEVNGLLVETKGRFTSQERKKFKLIKQSSTTYGMWCDRIGFPYAKELIPTKWLKENGNKKKN
mgnify:CR=1 FL=1